jgi:hypothetical protein
MAATAERSRAETAVPSFVPYDRRKSPDRRATWRGGRRDSDWTTSRPPGALRRFDSLQRRVVQFGKWRVALPFTSTARRAHPLLGLWAMLIVAVMTFAAAKTNYLLLEALYETVARPARPQPASMDDYIVVNA